MSDLKQTVRTLLSLRDAVRASERWEDVVQQLEQRNLTLDEVRARIRPHIDCDPHTHSLHSDGMFSYRQLIWWCKAVGIRALGVTDHDNISPAIGPAIEEGARLGVRLIPGLEYTVHQLGGQSWKGLEVGMHFFPSEAFAEFMQSEGGARFCERFRKAALLKSDQAWNALQAVNERLAEPNGLTPISREELWQESGETDPVCASTITVILLARIYGSGRQDLLGRFPNTRVIWSYMNRNGYVAPIEDEPQTMDGLIEIRETLAEHGIRSTITLNHPEEWLTKCGLTDSEGAPDTPAVRRLSALLLLHEPERAPISFIELYTPRNTLATRPYFRNLHAEFEEMRSRMFPQIRTLQPIASTDSHRVSGFFGPEGEVEGWTPGEDFMFGIGMIDEEHPQGNLAIPEGYPSGEEVLRMMERCAD